MVRSRHGRIDKASHCCVSSRTIRSRKPLSVRSDWISRGQADIDFNRQELPIKVIQQLEQLVDQLATDSTYDWR